MLVFVDESGTHRAMTPLYSRAPRGQRASGTVPRNRGRATTRLAALSLAGLGAAMTIDGGTSQPVFEAYVKQVLVPTLRPGQTVIMDNVGAHQREQAQAAIRAAHCRVLFLPAYSPDLSPIELAFSKLKGVLNRLEARTQDALEAAIGVALRTVTAEDARGWFAHCGYPPPAQPF